MSKYKAPRAEQIAVGIGLCAAIGGTAYCVHKYLNASRANTLFANMDLGHQADDVPDIPGAKRSVYSEELLDSYEGATTPYEVFLKGVEISGDNPYLGTRIDDSYSWITYNEVQERAINLGSGILELGYQPTCETFVGIYAANKVEWILTDIACQAYSMISVPLYDSLGADACTHIINHAVVKDFDFFAKMNIQFKREMVHYKEAEISVIICDGNKLDILMEKADQCPQLKHIIKIGDVSEEDVKNAGKFGITIKSFQDIEEMGRNNRKEVSPGKPDDVYTVCFTSGTTGTPKGAMITNRNVVSNVAALHLHLKRNDCVMVSTDVAISYLPLPHMYERIGQALIRSVGASSGFFRGDIKLLLDDIQLLRPTSFPSVPRLLNRLYDKISAGVESSGGLKKWLFYKAFDSKKADFEKGQIYRNGFWDKLVFRKIQAILGGNVRIITTGAAPIEAKVLTFLKVVLGCAIFEGFGQTESTAVATFTNVFDVRSGHVGPPAACCYVKLTDVPEMEYYTSNNQGEVCIYGPNVFKGYLKEAKKTAETIDEDGWLHTGDIGEWNKNGTLKIIGRKKCIFKLSQGEYVAPDKIENIYIKSPYVAQAFVHGKSLKSCIVGIIVPDEEVLMKWAADNGVSKTFVELCQNEDVKEMILKDILARGKEATLPAYEQVKNILLHPELFSIENGLLTPTLKSKRFEMQKRFAKEIDELYEKLDQVTKPKL